MAVKASKEAFASWADTPARQRGALIAKCGELLREHADELAKLTALETGKALRTESAVEAGVLSDTFTFFGGLGSELKGTKKETECVRSFVLMRIDEKE